MRFAVIVSAFLSLAACVWAETITVKVAAGGNLTFTPDNVTAKQGDVLAFQFTAGNHTVTQSSFNDPCTKLSTGVDSGYQPVSANASTIPQWSFTVNDTSSPLWFYCKQAQGGHCKAGMVFAVNPTANETFNAFKSRAANTTTNSNSTGSSSTGSSSTASSPSPSASKNPSSGAVLGLNPYGFTGIITLVAIFAASIF